MNYNDYIANQERGAHFWYLARHRLLEKLLSLEAEKTAENNEILDLGSGIGEEFELMKKYGRVTAVDNDPRAIAIAKQKNVRVRQLDLEKDELPPADTLCLFDILEHLAGDQAVLERAARALRPGGRLLITAPAFPGLFSPHDRATGHRRRYRKNELAARIKTAGFTEVQLFYWNTLLFPAEALYRLFKKIRGGQAQTDAVPLPRRLDRLLYWILALEVKYLFANKRLPFGLTIYGLAQK